MLRNKAIVSVGKTVQQYFDGMHQGDAEQLRRAFHPQACLFGFLNGRFSHVTLEDWLSEVARTAKPSENGEKFDMQIVETDIVGQTALVKVVELRAGLRYTTHLSLALLDGHWRIVNKLYCHH
jgi:hypothetical protein